MSLREEWRAFLAAAQFLTRAPIVLNAETWAEDVKRSLRYFPAVGGAVGFCSGAVYALAALAVPPLAAAALALAVEALITGALHEDGFADYCDAMGAARTPEQTLAILKDSRIGGFGAVGLTLGLLLRAACLAALPGAQGLAASAFAGALSRLSASAALAAAAPVKGASLAALVGGTASAHAVIASLALAAPFAIAAAWSLSPAVLLAAPLAALLCAMFVRQMRRRVGGLIGDGLGALIFAAQCGTLLVCASVAGVITHP
ncbi:MAG: adenosylcobinamide-GDP ribazoletransferase [Hyphomicrobiales bacterium]|nr:adenosylcobinamide-GDP ribazoletransferase [Hyphomicrobiales bacterium]